MTKDRRRTMNIKITRIDEEEESELTYVKWS